MKSKQDIEAEEFLDEMYNQKKMFVGSLHDRITVLGPEEYATYQQKIKEEKEAAELKNRSEISQFITSIRGVDILESIREKQKQQDTFWGRLKIVLGF